MKEEERQFSLGVMGSSDPSIQDELAARQSPETGAWEKRGRPPHSHWCHRKTQAKQQSDQNHILFWKRIFQWGKKRAPCKTRHTSNKEEKQKFMTQKLEGGAIERKLQRWKLVGELHSGLSKLDRSPDEPGQGEQHHLRSAEAVKHLTLDQTPKTISYQV